jgi:hypothetical protein
MCLTGIIEIPPNETIEYSIDLNKNSNNFLNDRKKSTKPTLQGENRTRDRNNTVFTNAEQQIPVELPK